MNSICDPLEICLTRIDWVGRAFRYVILASLGLLESCIIGCNSFYTIPIYQSPDFLSPFRRRRALVPSLVCSVVLEKLVHSRSDGRCIAVAARVHLRMLKLCDGACMREQRRICLDAPIINVLSSTRLVVA